MRRRGADERAGLAQVHVFERRRRPSARRRPRSIACPPTMPATPAASASTLTARRQPMRPAAPPRRRSAARRRGPPREHAERLREQAVARENREAVAVDDVRGRPAPAQRVVVHRRQVVVHERVGVDHLDRARGGQCRALAPSPARGSTRSGHGFGGGERQAGPKALARPEQRVADGRGDDGGPAQAGEHPLEGGLDLGA